MLTGLLGDTVMCTPAILETRRLFPRARIVGLVTTQNKKLLESSGWFDAFYVYDGSPFPLHPAKLKHLNRVQDAIRTASADLAIILLGDDFAPLLSRAQIPWRVGVRESYFAGLMTSTYTIGETRKWGPNERLNALRCLGLSVSPVLPQMWVSEQARDTVESWLPRRGNAPRVTIHPFAATPSRALPPARIAELADCLVRQFDAQVILVGGPQDRPVAEQSVMLAGPGLENFVGKMSIQETCALMEQSDVVVSTDSGPLHLAGALQRPAVGLFRAIRPEYASLYPTVVPVFWDGDKTCLDGCTWDSWYGCRTIPCRQLVGIGVEKIVNAVCCQLENAQRHRPVPRI